MTAKTHSVFIAALSIALSSGLQAVTLAKYDFETANGISSSDTELTSVAGNFTRVGYTSNTGLSTSNGGNYFTRVQVSPNSETAALGNDAMDPNNGNYYSFTLTPTVAINLDSLVLDYRRSTGGLSPAPVFMLSIRSSVDSYGANIGNFTADNTNATIDLSSNALYQNVTSPIQFRLYFFDDSNSTDSSSIVHRLYDMELTGTVPEPTAPVLFSSLGLIALFRRRR